MHFDPKKAKRADKRRRDLMVETTKRIKGYKGDKKDRKKIRYDEKEAA